MLINVNIILTRTFLSVAICFCLVYQIISMKIKLQFIGATGTVTGSKFLLSVDKGNYLVDCGLFQGLKKLRRMNWETLPIEPSDITSVVLSHAHVDHSGYIPLMVKRGFKGVVFATHATRSLCQILLPDAGYLQEEDAEYANKHEFSRHRPALPLFTEKDARESLASFKSIAWDTKVPLSRNVSFQFLEAGHIIGASLVQFNCSGRIVTFSSDLGRQSTLTMNPPKEIRKSDYLVLESTYGNAFHPKNDPYVELKNIINKTIKRGGIVLIPAFAVGRTEKLLLLLSRLRENKDIPDVPIYVNSPMASRATKVFCTFHVQNALTSDECSHLLRVAHFVSTTEESKNLSKRKDPAIIISASGMATGGRVLHHLKRLVTDPKNTILFVGFQAAGTRGEALVNHSKHIKIHGESIPVKAKVKVLETLSAHADQDEIITWLKSFEKPPKTTFLTHGEPDACIALKERIEEELHWNVQIPDYLDSYELK